MRFRKRNRGCFFAFNAYNILNKGAGRIACTYPFRRYVLSYRITVQPLAGEWTVIFALIISNKRNDCTKHDDKGK